MDIGGLVGRASRAASISKTVKRLRSGSGSTDAEVDVDVKLAASLDVWTRRLWLVFRADAEAIVDGEDAKGLVGDGVGKGSARCELKDDALCVGLSGRSERRVPTRAGA